MPAFLARPVVLALLFLSLISGGVAPSTAEAGVAWCRVDPVVVIDGQLADIFVASDLSMHFKATGPIELVISIPKGSSGTVILSDTGFGFKGYRISFVADPTLERTSTRTPVRVSAYAPSTDSSLPVEVIFAPRSLSYGLWPILLGMSAGGTANSWVTLTT